MTPESSGGSSRTNGGSRWTPNGAPRSTHWRASWGVGRSFNEGVAAGVARHCHRALEPHGAVTLPQIGGGPTVGRRRGPIGALPPWLDFLERHLSLTGS